MKSPQPNSRYCFVCGLQNPIGLHLRFYQTGAGEIEANFQVPEIYQGYPGIVHGGVVAAMLDELAGRALMGGEPATRFMFTARLNVRYRKNVPVEQPLRLVGRMEEDRGRTATATSAIYNEQGTLLAEAEALLVNLPESMLEQADLEALGWKVYPDE